MRGLYTLALVATLALVSEGRTIPSDCAALRDGMLIPHESNSHKFYECAYGQKVEFTCPRTADGYLCFNPELQICDWPEFVPQCYAPVTAEPTTEEPAPTEPATEEPATAEPTTPEPATAEPTTEVPAPTEPATEGPSPTEPATEGSTPTEPATEGPSPTEPATEGSTPTEPATEGPSPTEPPTEPATEGPAPTEPATEGTSPTEPATAEPTTPEPATAEPTTPEPATAEPTTEVPVPTDPATDEPASSEAPSTTASYPGTDFTEKATCPSTGSGNLPHENDCTLYYHCDNGQYVVYACGVGLVFNPRLRVCDYIKNVPECRKMA
ncbi:uncharacterized protein LOC144477562 [Augochlora pura]